MKKLQNTIGKVVFWGLWPAWWVYLRINPPRSRVWLECNGEVMLVRGWLSAGNYELPGGGSHRGESAEAAAIREVREETGVTLSDRELKPLLSNIRIREHGLSYMCNCFVVTRTDKPKAAPRQLEINEVRWVKVEGLSSYRIGADIKAARAALHSGSPDLL
jgi:8-oxo-dGTP pyrophosphatase MutT (NUDIX family)